MRVPWKGGVEKKTTSGQALYRPSLKSGKERRGQKVNSVRKGKVYQPAELAVSAGNSSLDGYSVSDLPLADSLTD